MAFWRAKIWGILPWKIMENMGVSWKIMENHGKYGGFCHGSCGFMEFDENSLDFIGFQGTIHDI